MMTSCNIFTAETLVSFYPSRAVPVFDNTDRRIYLKKIGASPQLHPPLSRPIAQVREQHAPQHQRLHDSRSPSI